MTYRLYLLISLAAWIAAVALAILGMPWWWPAATAAVALIFTLLLWRAIHKPLMAVNNGIYLLREQDFSSRLRHTGQRDADKVVDLFNRLMNAMKAERLRQLEQTHLMSLLIEASPMGIAICDFDDKIISANKAYHQLVDPGLEARLHAMADDEVITIRTDGSQVCRCSRLWFMDSGFRRRFYLVELMTEEILKAEKQMFNKIVRTIGHEVNNTMGSVVSVFDTLRLMHQSDPDIATVLDSSATSCLNLAEFVRGYSSVVKLPAPQPEPTDLNRLLDSMLPSLRHLAPDNISIQLHPSSETRIVQLDPMLIQRVVSNIVKNSIESIGSKPDGIIDINLQSNTLDITDNGAGIPPEATHLIFTPFFSTKRTDRGLGLMLVADILRAHKASFSLSTNRASMLTTFSIRFK